MTRQQGLGVEARLKNLRRFKDQPRLVLAWLIAMGRSSWWVLFFIYTPIFAVQNGLGALAGGAIVSCGTAFLLLLPIFARYARRVGIRRVLLNGFTGVALLTGLVAPLAGWWPALAALVLLAAALTAVTMDSVGNTPFMLAVHPHERAEMTSVYSTYRDMAELGPPGAFALLLRHFDLAAVYVAGALTMLLLAGLSRRMNPRLGQTNQRAPVTG